MKGSAGVALFVIALIVGGCTTTSPQATPTHNTPLPGEASTSPPAGPPASAGEPSGQAGLLLNEVRFAPAAGEPAFVEVSNTSPEPIDMAGATLRFGGADLVLADSLALPAGAQLLVLLDGLGSVEGTVIHAGSEFSLPPDHGTVELLDRAGFRLDRIAWGDAEPDPVASGPGGIIPPAFEAGTTIGRAPGANGPQATEDWLVYGAADASPGHANPTPPVSVLLPVSGAILESDSADLFWYPVPGASTYRVQVAADDAFATPVLDTSVTEPQVNVAGLPPAEYLWRVAAIAADGTAARFSEPADFELASAATGALAMVETAVVADTPGKHLSVPVLDQRKDTAMLLLERNVETGPHSWDKDHGALDTHDPADNKNCAIATVAMISAFYGGNLSQDRIGYEVLKRRGNPAGPEGDLVYGHGISGLEASEAFRFALGGVTEGGLMSFEDMWNAIVREIDAGRPVAGANSHHGFVVTGYEVKAGRRLITINDPWHGRTYKQDIDANLLPPSDFNLWFMPAAPQVRQQEASVTADSDGDGVVDFDESERFKTNPNDSDSDGDLLPDKQDIISGVFDPTYGYAGHVGSPFGRDYDDDGIPTELDKDSDEGRCLDGLEDKNRNGHRDESETWNFNGDDDRCDGWVGTMSITRKWTYSNGSETGSATTTFDGIWMPDENSQHYDYQCQTASPPPDCPKIFLPTGTITWSFSAQCGDRSDSGAGVFEAGTGFAYPEFDWDQQAIYLRRTPDGKKFQYWGQGVMVGITDQGEPYCPAGNSDADAERYFFEILEDAADRQPSAGTIQTCIGRAFEIGVEDTDIAGSCEDKSVAGETDSVWTWSLQRVGNP